MSEKREGFMTPPNHIGFEARRLFGACGEIADGAIAYVAPGGGGPVPAHTHPHAHLFVVVAGRARIQLGEEYVVVHANESYLVKGGVLHAVFNDGDSEAVILGITVNEPQARE